MLKSIKKSFKYFAIIAGITLAIPTAVFFLIRIPEVQTFMISRIAGHISRETGTTIKAGRIEFSLFNRLVVHDVLIEDMHRDTLIYAQRVNAGIRRLDFRSNVIRLGNVIITKPSVALITDSAGTMNLSWYLNLLSSNKDSLKSRRPLRFSINRIDLDSARFFLINRRGDSSRMLIDFNDLRLSGINAGINDFRIEEDSVSMTINGLSFRESKGFTVSNLDTRMILAGGDIVFTDVSLNCDSSIINADIIGLYPDTSGSFGKFTQEVRLDIRLNKSLVNSTDLKYFLPVLKNINEDVGVSGRVSGYVEEMKGRNIQLSYREMTNADIDFDLSGLPDIGDAFIYLGINKLNASISDIEKIRLPSGKMIVLPEMLSGLGEISFDGNFTGFTTDFVTFGSIRTEQGNVRTDVSLRPEGKNSFRIKGLISGQSINLGEITGNSELLGKISMDAEVDGNASSLNRFSGSLTATVDSAEINGYTYRNAVLNGTFTEKTWDGSINIDEKNIKMDLLGMFDFRNELPEFDFTLNLANANFHRLNIDKTDSLSGLSMLMTANFKGSNIDNLNGEIRVLNSTLRKTNNKLDLYDLSLKASSEGNQPLINLKTDFLSAELRGYYNFAGLGSLFRTTLASMMPSRFKIPAPEKNQRLNNFTFNIIFNNSDKLNSYFNTGFSIAEKTGLKGSVLSDSLLTLSLSSDRIEFKNNTLNGLSLEAGIKDSVLKAGLKAESLSILGQSDLSDFNIGINTITDNFRVDVDWDNREEVLNNGHITARGSFEEKITPGANPVLRVAIDSSGIYSADKLWILANSAISLDTSSVRIEKFRLSNEDNYYMVDGKLSEDPRDTLHLEMSGINLSFLNNLGSKKKKDGGGMQLDLGGVLEGNFLVTGIYNNPMFETNIKIGGFKILGGEYGDIGAESVWNTTSRVLDLKAGSNFEGIRMFDASGVYDPETKKIDLGIETNGLPLDALNPLLGFFASGIQGKASGKLRLSGELNRLLLTGAVKAENTAMTIDYLQTRYTINDTVRFDSNGISFDNVNVTDDRGNLAVINGAVNHKHFSDFAANLTVNVDNTMVLNTKPKDNELFYGTAFASGVTTIKSGQNSLNFDISARTERNTKFYMPLNSGLTVSDYSFINFVVPDSLENKSDDKASAPETEEEQNNGSGIGLNFEVEVTPEAEIQLLIDPKAGDVISGRGSGTLNLNLSPKGDFRISGDYIIEDGEYLYTLGNILNKPFSVENGGRITFNGDIENAEIDLVAKYRLNTSLFEILQDERYNERIPVECHLILSGKLFNPVIGLDIYLPRADEETRSYLNNMITTEEEKSRQFLYLLVMNSFYAGSMSRSNINTTSTGTTAMAVTTTEMLSNQLSNMLSQLSNDFDIGFNYRPGYRGLSSQEVQVALSTQLLNDKVTINGNFDVRGSGNNTGNTNQITGDFDAEVKLTERIRFRVFNRFNNPYTGKGVPYTQGIGLLYKQDFNRFSDLFGLKNRTEIKKEDEPELKQAGPKEK
ncbi:MAG: translocation/assembly module TamB domain-containing protein [Bacteroidales bacterium]|jgi:hypothetical protein|nr:translocation/assembly module TamB domain-containing protein [Bacteroidales bacterium]